MAESPFFEPGQRIRHSEFGEGVVIGSVHEGYLRVFFADGERRVPESSIQPLKTWTDRVLAHVEGSDTRLKHAWLACEAYSLPLIESAAALTAAPIDLLPHQVVLTHRIATAAPRRYLVADEVGLGKTIEAALLLRELASRGELKRALMVVPAGLVNNWHRELNEVFNLDFEVFGSEGDVTDRKSNAFAKHNRLIASIDTLKRRSRVQRLLDAPRWDLIVFDEAHHLTAYRSGRKVRKTENYKLAEALKNHTRDLVLLSATPHQGDHFRFWMLVQLLNPTLFVDPDEMIANRHRLNTIVFRRTKADACKPDGTPLFARRWVHTESFTMTDDERAFYVALSEYLEEGFALAKRQGNEGRALGFVMTIFQKIAASSFAAVRRTLTRRLIMLTLHEAIIKDQELDIDARDKLYSETRDLIHEEHAIPMNDAVSKGKVDAILADLKVRMLKRLDEDDLAMASNSASGEEAAAAGEDTVAMAVSLALPEERLRIRHLLQRFPESRETKVEKLLRGLGALWEQNPKEKVVIFVTYLGTVSLIEREIERAYPGQGVVVLRGGDHGAKLAAERRFKKPDGPRVLVCTAAGREGINLQVARVLFNFDLPWNPMDVEQRIGRIHRYGQKYTTQVYNLVLSDTIEGRIFLLLTDKLQEIARTLGKVDERGDVAEDLRMQILGQLSERLTYDTLYREALSDPELRRTKEELEAAMSTATEARQVVFELFQDLDGFSLEDYKPLANVEAGFDRIVQFLSAAMSENGQEVKWLNNNTFIISSQKGNSAVMYTTDREFAREQEGIELMGLDHPIMIEALERWQGLAPESLSVSVNGNEEPAVISWWLIHSEGANGEHQSLVKPLAVGAKGNRDTKLEREGLSVFKRQPGKAWLSVEQRREMLSNNLEPMLQRELHHRGLIPKDGGYSSKLIGWIEVSGETEMNETSR